MYLVLNYSSSSTEKRPGEEGMVTGGGDKTVSLYQ